MNAINSVLLFTLVWIFTAVCQADDGTCSVSCDDVTGYVGKEVNLTCRVSLQRTDCCIEMYKYIETYNDTHICKEFPKDSCEHRSSLTCQYTPTTAMTAKFKFFLQTTCDAKTTEFTVSITGTILKEENIEKSTADTEAGLGYEVSVVAAVVGCFILLLMTIIRNKNPNFNRSCRSQTRISLYNKHDEDNSDRSEDVM